MTACASAPVATLIISCRLTAPWGHSRYDGLRKRTRRNAHYIIFFLYVMHSWLNFREIYFYMHPGSPQTSYPPGVQLKTLHLQDLWKVVLQALSPEHSVDISCNISQMSCHCRSLCSLWNPILYGLGLWERHFLYYCRLNL